MVFNKILASIIILFSSMDSSGWVHVERPERVPHQLEEDDPSVWVVFSKTFGEDRILLRFPEDPVYRSEEGRFRAKAPYIGGGEFLLTVHEKSTSEQKREGVRDIYYREAEGMWVRERHIDTNSHHYVLRFSHSSGSETLFRKFADSFEIENHRKF